MSDLKKYKTPKGIIAAWFLNKQNNQPQNVQYGYEGSKNQNIISEIKFLEIVKRNKWEPVA